ncbi:MAG: hypothetical protein KBF33_13130, partial [Comamonas sp.]|nr:hypothetical protein [Comamonas sp.]
AVSLEIAFPQKSRLTFGCGGFFVGFRCVAQQLVCSVNVPTGTDVKPCACLIPEQTAVPFDPIFRRTLGVSP